jgi:hypothetical protein
MNFFESMWSGFENKIWRFSEENDGIEERNAGSGALKSGGRSE